MSGLCCGNVYDESTVEPFGATKASDSPDPDREKSVCSSDGLVMLSPSANTIRNPWAAIETPEGISQSVSLLKLSVRK